MLVVAAGSACCCLSLFFANTCCCCWGRLLPSFILCCLCLLFAWVDGANESLLYSILCLLAAAVRMGRYGANEFREDLQRLYRAAGTKNEPTAFLFTDTQIVVESFLEDINGILNSGEVGGAGVCMCAVLWCWRVHVCGAVVLACACVGCCGAGVCMCAVMWCWRVHVCGAVVLACVCVRCCGAGVCMCGGVVRWC
jgi:hypothetical protein